MELKVPVGQRELDEIIRLAQTLIRVPTENPPGNYETFRSVLSEAMEDAGLEVHVICGQEDKPNVVGIWRGNPGSEAGEDVRTLLLSGHMDVVGAGRTADWKYPPYQADIAEGKLWGRGSADMKAAIACMVYAAKLLRQKGWQPAHNLMIAGTVDDEIAGKMGMKYLLDKGLEDSGLPRPTFHVLGEATDLNLMVAFKGRTWLRVGVQGKAAHGGAPHEGVNAVDKALDFALKMRGLVSDSVEKPHPMLGPDTCNLGTICGGTRVNVVPDLCVLEYDIRMGPPRNAQAYIQEVRRVLDETSRAGGFEVSRFEVFEERDPVETPPGDPHVAVLSDIISRVTGRTPLRLGTLSAGDLYYSLKQGIPGVWFGPGDPGVLHKVNECVPIEHLRMATEVYALLAVALCS